MIPLLVVLVLVVIVGLWGVGIYNSLVVLGQRVNNAWSQVEVQLRRRYDLVPNLVETVKGYTEHERGTLTAVTEARARAMGAKSVEEQQAAEADLTNALGRLVNAVAEAYPDLKASENFQRLQAQLAETENKIAFSRQFYNDTVQKFNIRLGLFPGNIIAGMLGYTPKAYFDAPEEAEGPVHVKF